MSGSITLRNHKRLTDEFLAPGTPNTIGGVSVAGDKILVAAIDGECMVIDNYSSSIEKDINKIKKVPMTLFPTDRNVIVYGSNSGLRRDFAMAIPYKALKGISFKVVETNKKYDSASCTISFISKPQTNYPSLLFFTNINDIFTYDAIRATLAAVRGASGIKIEDNTSSSSKALLGLNDVKGTRG